MNVAQPFTTTSSPYTPPAHLAKRWPTSKIPSSAASVCPTAAGKRPFHAEP
jgi:hypothetical protein